MTGILLGIGIPKRPKIKIVHTVRTVVRTRDAALLHRPTLFMNTCNATFWILYGAARHNPIIVFPNAVGGLLGVAQVVLCLCFPPKPTRQSSENGDDRETLALAENSNYNLLEEQDDSS
jgi:hypothetical protein